MRSTAGAVLALRRRVDELVSVNVSDRDALSVCVACSFPRDREYVMGLLLNERQSALALGNAERLAVSVDEYSALFGSNSHASGDAAMGVVAASPKLAAACTSLHSALKCSLSEDGAAACWRRSCSRAVCLVALYTDSTEEIISAVLGGLVKADARRLDDVRSDVEDSDTEHVGLCQMIMSLSASIV